MTRCALLDVNVLIALHDPDHVHHARVVEWMLEQAPHGWATCTLTQLGMLRIMSQPAYPNALPLAQVMSALARSTAHAVHHFWACNLSVLDPQRVRADRLHGHQQLTDVTLLALAVAHEGKLATLDQRIPLSAVHGAQAHHLEVL
ncbi:TA system VapC family ribonuclease toxin [Ideonella sp.]|uniref:TA system VapC family ribonuclease toxin n=1 Tax=Ideonella sp. TaxID=1929293 RepID=UPI0037C086FC